MAFGGENTNGKPVKFVKMNKLEGKMFYVTKEATDQSVPHVLAMGDNKGKTQHRVYAKYIEGTFKEFKVEDGKWGYFYLFLIEDEDTIYQLSLKGEDYNARLYALKLATCSRGDKVKLGVFKADNEDGTTRNVGYVMQNDQKTGYKFTKEEVPAPIKVEKRGGKVEYEYDEVFTFFDTKVIPLLADIATKGSEAPMVAPAEGATVEEGVGDELPF